MLTDTALDLFYAKLGEKVAAQARTLDASEDWPIERQDPAAREIVERIGDLLQSPEAADRLRSADHRDLLCFLAHVGFRRSIRALTVIMKLVPGLLTNVMRLDAPEGGQEWSWQQVISMRLMTLARRQIVTELFSDEQVQSIGQAVALAQSRNYLPEKPA